MNTVETFHATQGKPTVILLRTVKGKGVSFMENQVGWHGKAPNDEEFQRALNELSDARKKKDRRLQKKFPRTPF